MRVPLLVMGPGPVNDGKAFARVAFEFLAVAVQPLADVVQARGLDQPLAPFVVAAPKWSLCPLAVVLWPVLGPVAAKVALASLVEGEATWVAYSAKCVRHAVVKVVQEPPRLLLAVDVVAVPLVRAGRPLHEVDAVVLPHLFVWLVLAAASLVLQQLLRLVKTVGPKCWYKAVYLGAVLRVAAWLMAPGVLIVGRWAVSQAVWWWKA